MECYCCNDKSSNLIILQNDIGVCPVCYEVECKPCEICEHRFVPDDIKHLDQEGINVCQWCLEDHCEKCLGCKHTFTKEGMLYVGEEDRWICSSCEESEPDPDIKREERREQGWYG